MTLKQENRIILDPFMMKQYSMLLNSSSKDMDETNKLMLELKDLENIEDIEEARNLIYRKFPKFRETKCFVNMGVKYCLKDKSDKLSLFVYFNDSIKCFSYQ